MHAYWIKEVVNEKAYMLPKFSIGSKWKDRPKLLWMNSTHLTTIDVWKWWIVRLNETLRPIQHRRQWDEERVIRTPLTVTIHVFMTSKPTTVPPVVQPSSGNAIIINPCQVVFIYVQNTLSHSADCQKRLNPLLDEIRNVLKEFGDIVPDFQVGRTTGVLFLR